MDTGQSAGKLLLLYRDEDGAKSTVPVEKAPFTLGRSPLCDLVLPFTGVSRVHARLVNTEDGKWAIEDLESTNGTFLNGNRIAGTESLGRICSVVLGSASIEIRIQDSSLSQISQHQTIVRSVAELSRDWASKGVESTDLQSPTVARLRDLVEIAKGLNLAVSIESIFDQAREVVFRYLRDVERLALLVDIEGSGELSVLNSALRGQGIQSSETDGTDWISRSICQKAFEERLAIQTADAQTDDRFGGAQSIFFKGIRSAVAVPLWNEEKVVGVFYADAHIPSDRWERSGSEDLAFFSSLANLVATAVQRWQLAEKLRAEGIIRQRLERVAQFLETQQSEEPDDLVGKSPLVKKLGRQIKEQAQIGGPLLLQGEAGTGKELIARLIHLQSERRAAVFFGVDCSEISENDWGDKLFGTRHQDGYEDAPTGPFCYVELCQGGSILLRNVENLPLSIQERLKNFLERCEQGKASFRDVRVMVSCRGDLGELASAGRISEELSRILLQNVLPIAPLRERKKDIPDLAEYFLKKHSERLGKPVQAITDDAITKLVSYDYHAANVQELEEAIRRAVILAEAETIHSETIFLGPPPVAPQGFNWLTLPAPVVRFGVRILPRVFQVAAAAIIGFILYECFFGPPVEEMNLGTILVWSVWWPFLAFSFLVAGRVWCAVCPMGQASAAVRPFWKNKLKVPGWLKKYDTFLVMGGFTAIVWVEEATDMRHSPAATGLLLLSILVGAISFGLLFPRRTWCRYVCPLGGLAGVCASSSIVQLRPTFDICAAKCEGHDCFKGTDQVQGCPLFNHLMFVDSNQHCILCMNCVQSCSNGSPQFSFRAPGRELWTNLSVRPETARLVALLLGLLTGMSLLQFVESQSFGPMANALEDHRYLTVTIVIVMSCLIPLSLFYLWEKHLATRVTGSADLESSRRKIGAFVPLLAAGLLAYHLGSIPGLEWLNATLDYRSSGEPMPWVSLPLLEIFRVAVLSFGLFITMLTLMKLKPVSGVQQTRNWLWNRRAGLVGATGYWVLLVALMIGRGWQGF
jgi:transcriptional regulator with GAF, ATPase, and Fis domain/polyferredoxin